MSFNISMGAVAGVTLHISVTTVLPPGSRWIGCTAAALAADWLNMPDLVLIALGQAISWFLRGEMAMSSSP